MRYQNNPTKLTLIFVSLCLPRDADSGEEHVLASRQVTTPCRRYEAADTSRTAVNLSFPCSEHCQGGLTWSSQPFGLSSQSSFPLRYTYSTMLTQALFTQENPLNICKHVHALPNIQTAASAVFKGLTLGDTSTFPQLILPSGEIPDLH